MDPNPKPPVLVDGLWEHHERKPAEEFETAEAEPVSCLQFGVECPGELLVRLEQPDPRVRVGV